MPMSEWIDIQKNESANAIKGVKRLCIGFGFHARMLKNVLAEGSKKK